MLGLSLNIEPNATLRVLYLGAHSDDIEIGCGGTTMRLADTYENLEIYWIVLGAHGERTAEARDSAETFLRNVEKKEIIVRGFRDGYFPYIGIELKEYFEQLKRDLDPDLIFTHYRHDLHQDHRLTSELTWNTFRNHLILEYEIPKYDGDLAAPNFFVYLDEATCKAKARQILSRFETQRNRHWFTEDTLLSILRLRGIECRAPDGYAEAFYCRKMVF